MTRRMSKQQSQRGEVLARRPTHVGSWTATGTQTGPKHSNQKKRRRRLDPAYSGGLVHNSAEVQKESEPDTALHHSNVYLASRGLLVLRTVLPLLSSPSPLLHDGLPTREPARRVQQHRLEVLVRGVDVRAPLALEVHLVRLTGACFTNEEPSHLRRSPARASRGARQRQAAACGWARGAQPRRAAPPRRVA